MEKLCQRSICMAPESAGRETTETKGTVVANADRPRATRNVFIFDNGVALKGPKMS